MKKETIKCQGRVEKKSRIRGWSGERDCFNAASYKLEYDVIACDGRRSRKAVYLCNAHKNVMLKDAENYPNLYPNLVVEKL